MFLKVIIGALIVYWILKKVTKSESKKISEKAILNQASIRIEPTIIRPIQPFDFGTSKETLLSPVKPMPKISDSWLSVIKDHDALMDYIVSLDSHKNAAESAAQRAIHRFEQDHRLIIDQQTQLFRRVFQSKECIAPFFSELKNLNPSLDNLPESLRIIIPSSPTYPKPNDIAKKYTLIPHTAGSTISKSVTQNGGLTNCGNIAGLAIAAGIFVVKAKSNISKLKRVAEDAKGQVSSYSVRLQSTVEILELAHTELVVTSARLKHAEQEIIPMVNKVRMLPQGLDSLDNLAPDSRNDVAYLYYLLHYAEQSGRNLI